MESGAVDCVSSHARNEGSDTDLVDETVEPAPRITLMGPRKPPRHDSASIHAPVATGLALASGSAAAPQVISDTEAEEQTGGAKGSVSGMEEDEAAERARVRFALTIIDLATL